MPHLYCPSNSVANARVQSFEVRTEGTSGTSLLTETADAFPREVSEAGDKIELIRAKLSTFILRSSIEVMEMAPVMTFCLKELYESPIPRKALDTIEISSLCNRKPRISTLLQKAVNDSCGF